MSGEVTLSSLRQITSPVSVPGWLVITATASWAPRLFLCAGSSADAQGHCAVTASICDLALPVHRKQVHIPAAGQRLQLGLPWGGGNPTGGHHLPPSLLHESTAVRDPTLGSFAAARAFWRRWSSWAPSTSSRGWHVSQAYTVRAAMSQVRTLLPQRPQLLWL